MTSPQEYPPFKAVKRTAGPSAKLDPNDNDHFEFSQVIEYEPKSGWIGYFETALKRAAVLGRDLDIATEGGKRLVVAGTLLYGQLEEAVGIIDAAVDGANQEYERSGYRLDKEWWEQRQARKHALAEQVKALTPPRNLIQER
jgi:hypothetical protein